MRFGRARELGVLVLLLGGCADSGRLPVTPDAGRARLGVLAVSVTHAGGAAPTVSSQARFIRFGDLDTDAAQVLAGVEPWPWDSLAPGRCTRAVGERLVGAVLEGTSPDAHVALLDGGDVVVRVAGRAERLEPRYVPEILPFVSGVLYESDTPGAAGVELPLTDELDVWLSGFGGPDVGRFDLQATLPSTPIILGVGDGSGAIDRSRPLDVSWGGAGDEREGDAVFVTLRWGDGEAWRCRAETAGAGRFVFGTELLGSVDGDLLGVAVERVRRVPWRAAGLDAGELTVTARDVVTARML